MNKLTDLRIEEVSFVDAGANPEAHVALLNVRRKKIWKNKRH